jgi:two-component system phosphate regulon sensor histidine kinase PhoR
MTPWLLVAILALTAGVLFLLWQRARSAQTRAEQFTERASRTLREAEATVHQHAAQLAALILAQPEAVLIVSPERIVTHLNPAATALFGPRTAIGQTLIFTTRSLELDELAGHALVGGQDCDRQISLHGLPYRARAVLAGEKGEYGVVLVLRDLSELQRLGRARRDFVANLSHELRTPLTSIRLLLDSLPSGAAHNPEEAGELLQKVGAEIQALEQIAQELLDLAQIESGQAFARLLPTPVAQLVSETVERLIPQADHKRQTVSVSVPADLVALADAEQVSRALRNLVHNAIKFTPPEGQIRVSAHRLDGDIVIEVADNGPGIPPDDLPRVFERFFRGDRARVSGGTGLGLAIAKHVVEAHGGRIWVENQGLPGHGATFRFTLLASDHPN